MNTAIAELGFVPNSIASALSSKKTGRVALVLDVNRHAQMVDEIPMQYIIGAINQAKVMGMDIITVFFHDDTGNGCRGNESVFSISKY